MMHNSICLRSIKKMFFISLFIFVLCNTYMLVSPSSTFQSESKEWNLSTKDLSPVILVPGDGGCQIEARWKKPQTVQWLCDKTEDDWSTLWLSLEDLTPYVIGCLVDNVRLVYNRTSRTTHNSPGVETRIPGFGKTYSVEFLDPYSVTHYFVGYFDGIVAELMKLGYERNTTIRGAPFDFRKAPNEFGDYYVSLTKLIETTANERKQRVTLIAHSMGAPVLHYFLNKKTQKWKDRYIDSLIALAGAWGGSAKPVKVYATGDNLGYFFIQSFKMKFAQRSLPSLAFLMPSLDVWDHREPLVQTPKLNYSLSNIGDYFKALDFDDGFEIYKDTSKLLYKAPPPGIKIHCLHGIGVPTIQGLIYKDEKSFPSYPTVVQGPGDGTVNNISATSCLRWSGGVQKEKIIHKTFDKVDHMNILRDAGVLQYIRDTLKSVKLRNSRRRWKKKEKKEWNKKKEEDNRIMSFPIVSYGNGG